MTIPEIVSELLFAGTPLKEIAGYDTTQMSWVRCRARDKECRLIRKEPLNGEGENGRTYNASGIPKVHRHVGFERMFRQVAVYRGLDEKQTEASWQDYLRKNPSLVQHLQEMKERREKVNASRRR